MPNPSTAESHLCFIISSYRPYCFDFNEILALPSGFRYRNRFSRTWVEPSLDGHVDDKLIGKRVLLVLRDANNNRLIPVRWGMIQSAQMIGSVAYFEYLLDSLIAYDQSDQVRLQEIIDRTTRFSQRHNWLPGPIDAPLTDPSVFWSEAGNALNTIDATDLSGWGNVVAAVATAPSFDRIEFLKIVGLFAANWVSAPIRDESYIVAPNSVYVLRVFQTVPAPGAALIPSHAIEVNTFPSHIIALRAKQQAVGKYDMLTFVLRILQLAPHERTAIEIPHHPDAATTNLATTSLYIPVAVRQSSPLGVIAASVAAIVSLYFMFKPNLGELSPDVVRNLATIIFVLILTGPARLLSSLWPHLPWRTER